MKNPHNLPYPRTSTQEVLFEIINEGKTSIMTFCWMSGFRSRISELVNVYGLKLERIMETRNNKFANPYTFANHILPESEKPKAIELYNKLNSQTK